jgi:hypothetical protein
MMTVFKGKKMRQKMSLPARRELLAVTIPRNQEADRKKKQTILSEFVAATGYHRKYAIRLLGRAPPHRNPAQTKRKRQRLYTVEVQEALVVVWEAANRICSKRLVPFLPELVMALERYGHLAIPAAVRQCLLAISPATVDRLLAGMRQKEAAYRLEGGGISHLKQQVPIRTFAEWSGAVPGFVEADLVFHCGGDVSGSHLHTLTLTDVVTGWTECLVLLFRDQRLVLQAIG